MNSIKHYPGKHEMSVFDFFRAEVNRQKNCGKVRTAEIYV